MIMQWLVKADHCAWEIGCKRGSYVVHFFVTGVVEANIEKYAEDWPPNCMVFGTEALLKLYKPFGKGIIEKLVKYC